MYGLPLQQLCFCTKLENSCWLSFLPSGIECLQGEIKKIKENHTYKMAEILKFTDKLEVHHNTNVGLHP